MRFCGAKLQAMRRHHASEGPVDLVLHWSLAGIRAFPCITWSLFLGGVARRIDRQRSINGKHAVFQAWIHGSSVACAGWPRVRVVFSRRALYAPSCCAYKSFAAIPRNRLVLTTTALQIYQ